MHDTDFVKILNDFLREEDLQGWDPYDGLNTPIIGKTFLGNYYIPKLITIQLCKRSPINFRPILGIKKGYNPKGLALVISGYCNAKEEKNIKEIERVSQLLCGLKSNNYSGNGWGYNFDWQSRAFFLSKYTPTVVVTSYAANALIDAYEITGEEELLTTALSSADFVLKDLKRTPKNKGFVFSYSPFDNTAVYNASLLGSKLLARIYSYNKKQELLDTAYASVAACADAQNEDGSWYYGELKIQKWIDSFHTGFNLESIHDFQKYSGISEFNCSIQKGLDYYINNFFLEDGTPKYYHNKVYPVDIHSPAQFIVTLSKLGVLKKHKTLAEKVMNWTIENMYDKKGFFYYQKHKYYTNKIPYMRWSQAWMFYALSLYNRELE